MILKNSPRFDFPENQEGLYLITLKAQNAFGCFDESQNEIMITQGISLFVPNAFTPDGDGINDEWSFQGLGIDALHIQTEIYDAWGVVIFSSSDARAIWNGANVQTDQKVHPGMYNYRIVARDTEHGVGHLYQGYVQVIR